MNKSSAKKYLLMKCASDNVSSVCYSNLGCFRTTNCRPTDSCYGCLNNKKQLLECISDNSSIECCNSQNFCNLALNRTENILPKNEKYFLCDDAFMTILAILAAIVFFMSLLFTILTFSIYKARKRQQIDAKTSKLKKFIRSPYQIAGCFKNEAANDFVHEISETTTGCGPGEFVQRTIGRDVQIDRGEHGLIGKGRYGTLYTGRLHGDQVAVKIFFSMHEISWSRETEIYQTRMLRHENVLGFIASDIVSSGCHIDMIIITEYHPLGSLYDYLHINTISKEKMLKFSASIANGLNHLHEEIFCSNQNYYKPVVVHRDLKTKNILVKSSLECCLADFGLSIRCDTRSNKMDTWCENSHSNRQMFNVREGSARYMAPECLNQTLNVESIESLKKTDIYSLSLVLWEILSRLDFVESNVEPEEHRPPFFEHVQGEPTVEFMKNIVCDKSIRPSLKFEPNSNLEKEVSEIVDVMKECWKANPDARLTSLNIKKRLKKLL